MASKLSRPPDAPPDDRSQSDDKTMTILEHLQELRNRLIICAVTLLITTILAFYPITAWVLQWMKEPAENRVENFDLVFTQPLEYWTTFFRVSLLIGLALAMPVILWQFIAYVGPGLTKNEKKWAYPIVLFASVMFVLGCAFAYYIELPPAFGFLFSTPGDVAEPFISVKAYVDFVTRLMLVTGIAFELPLVIMGLAKIGIVTSKRLISWWRYVIVGVFVLAAIITPSPDPVTQAIVAVPMFVLFLMGIALAKLVESTPLIPRA
jgi:sec-independent protein translocase protein TatC